MARTRQPHWLLQARIPPHPEQSRFLRDPLARAAGRLELCGKAVWENREHPAYRAALRVIQGWHHELVAARARTCLAPCPVRRSRPLGRSARSGCNSKARIDGRREAREQRLAGTASASKQARLGAPRGLPRSCLRRPVSTTGSGRSRNDSSVRFHRRHERTAGAVFRRSLSSLRPGRARPRGRCRC